MEQARVVTRLPPRSMDVSRESAWAVPKSLRNKRRQEGLGRRCLNAERPVAKGEKNAAMQHLLEWDYVPEYELIGISSSMGSHRLAWAFNRAFGWYMACADDVLAAPSKSQEPSSHPALRWIDEASGTSVTLVLNRTSEGTLAQ